MFRAEQQGPCGNFMKKQVATLCRCTTGSYQLCVCWITGATPRSVACQTC